MNEFECIMGGDLYVIPEYMRSGLNLYLDRGVKPGGFLTAILENDFVLATGKADGQNIANFPAYANWLYNHCPSDAWGSKSKVGAWISKGGYNVS